MTTFRGAVRSYNAARHRLEQIERRENREALKAQKQRQKEQQLALASHAVEEYEKYVKALVSVHKESSESIDWSEVLNEAAPVRPALEAKYEEAARKKLEQFKPSFFDKLFGTAGKLRKLQQAIVAGNQRDRQEYTEALNAHNKALESWKTLQDISKGILDGNAEAYARAVSFFSPFDAVTDNGYTVTSTLGHDSGTLDLDIFHESVVPDYTLSKTSTGKLSNKPLPASKFQKLFQEHLCSCALRIAREAFALLPLSGIAVNVVCEMLNTANGKMERNVVLSVVFYPDQLEGINFLAIDPAEAMKNFMHRMKFTSAGGFSPVDRIDINTVRRS